PTLFPYTTLFRSPIIDEDAWLHERRIDRVVILIRGDSRSDARQRVDRGIRGCDVGSGPKTPRGRGDIAQSARADRRDPRERERHDRDERGDRRRAEERATARW